MMARGSTILDLLLEKQVITSDIAIEAGRLQSASGKAPEEILIEMGALSEEDLAAFISDVMQLRFIKLEDVEIDREAVKHVPAAVAHRHMLIPVRRSGNTLVVAFADPTDSNAMEALKAVTDFEIIPFISRHDTLEHALFVHYGEPAAEVTESRKNASAGLTHSQLMVDDDLVSHMGKSIQINRQWSFDQYVADAANHECLAVARSVANFGSDSGQNPFLCWGAAGSGKSHLLHAIANHVSLNSPQKRFLFTTGQRFVDNLFEAIRDRKLNLFRYLYHKLDLLILDDADALMAHHWAQAELLETFERMRKSGRALVLAARSDLISDPRCLSKLREVLQSGMVTAFGEYSAEAKLALICRKKGGIELPQELLTYLVRRCGDSVKELLAVLQQVSVLAMSGEREITHDVVEDFIRVCSVEPDTRAHDQVEPVAEAHDHAEPESHKHAHTPSHRSAKRAAKQ